MITTGPNATEWQELLHRLEQRNGVIELSPLDAAPAAAPQVIVRSVASYEIRTTPVWRTRLLQADAGGLTVERPWSVRQMIAVPMNEPLCGLVIEGSSRWAFRTQAVDHRVFELNGQKNLCAIRLSPPTDLHSAQRRNYFRVEVAGGAAAELEAWVLLDPGSAAAALRANRLEHQRGVAVEPPPPPPVLGAKLRGTILDLSGGGMRVALPIEMQELMESWPPVWLQLTLPTLDRPLCTTARLVHWHVEAQGRIIAGLWFHDDHDPAHTPFVTESLCRVSAYLQRLQLQRKR